VRALDHIDVNRVRVCTVNRRSVTEGVKRRSLTQHAQEETSVKRQG